MYHIGDVPSHWPQTKNMMTGWAKRVDSPEKEMVSVRHLAGFFSGAHEAGEKQIRLGIPGRPYLYRSRMQPGT